MPNFKKSTGFKMKGFTYPGQSPLKQDKLVTKNIGGGGYDALKHQEKKRLADEKLMKKKQDDYDNTMWTGDVSEGNFGTQMIKIKQKYTSGSEAMTKAQIRKKLHTHSLDKSGEFVIKPESEWTSEPKSPSPLNPWTPTGPEYDM